MAIQIDKILLPSKEKVINTLSIDKVLIPSKEKVINTFSVDKVLIPEPFFCFFAKDSMGNGIDNVSVQIDSDIYVSDVTGQVLQNIISGTLTATKTGYVAVIQAFDFTGLQEGVCIDIVLQEAQCINRSFANTLNPFQFRGAGFEIGLACPPYCDDSSGLGCNNQYYREKQLNMPVLVAGDSLSFMLNLDLIINYTGYKVAILDADYNFVMQDIGLGVLNNADGTYTYYSSFTVPCLDAGCYFIAIYNPADNITIYLSRAFKEGNLYNWREYTRLLKYRNSFNFGGFKFEALPSFYQQIRLDINQSTYTLNSDKTSYREQSTKSIRNIQSTTDKNVVFKTFQFDEDLHDAMGLAFDCDSIELDDKEYRSFEAYEVNQSEGEDLTNGSVELYEVGFSYSSKSC